MTWIGRHKKKLLFSLAAVLLLIAGGVYGGIQRFKARFFIELPNTLSINGKLQSFPFRWVSQKFSDEYSEPHSAILFPVTVPGLANQFYMQFDTGCQFTFLRSGCLQEIHDHGVACELFEHEDKLYVNSFALNVGGNDVMLEPGRVIKRDIRIDWDRPEAINVIGTIGADFLDNGVCTIDFASTQIHLYRNRPEILESLGTFTPFDFTARRIMLPTSIDRVDMQVFYDSGCSSFGLFTSKYHFLNYAAPNEDGVQFLANRFGDKVPVHHKPCNMKATFGDAEIPLQRVSYMETYAGLQNTFGRFIDGGVLGNKSLTHCTLILDTKASEFLILDKAFEQR